MKKRLISLFLLLVVLGSASAGIPLHQGEKECGMDHMAHMDCCKAALLQTETPEVADAKLCCALVCAQNGTTSPPGSVRVTPPSAAGDVSHPAFALPQTYTFSVEASDRLDRPPGSPPTYLRNLTLLI